jgi:hypothetical protein
MSGDREKHARVYFRRDGKRVLVSTFHFATNGMLVEAEGPLFLTTWNEEELGECIQTALEQSSTWTKELRAKPSHWPSLKISGEPSERSFQASFIEIVVWGFPTFVLIDGFAFEKELSLRMELPAQAPPVEFARKVTRMFEICRDRMF